MAIRHQGPAAPTPRRDDRKNMRKLASVLQSLEHLATEWNEASLALAVMQARRQGLADPRFLFEIYKVLTSLASSESELSLGTYEWLDEHKGKATAEAVAEAVAVDTAGRLHMAELAALLASVSELIKVASTAQAEGAATTSSATS
jgi:hypothetical protein